MLDVAGLVLGRLIRILRRVVSLPGLNVEGVISNLARFEEVMRVSRTVCLFGSPSKRCRCGLLVNASEACRSAKIIGGSR